MTTKEATIQGTRLDLASRYLEFVRRTMESRLRFGTELDRQDAPWSFIVNNRALRLLQHDGLTEADWWDFPHYRKPAIMSELRSFVRNFDDAQFNIRQVADQFISLRIISSIRQEKAQRFRQALIRFFSAIACGEITEADLKTQT